MKKYLIVKRPAQPPYCILDAHNEQHRAHCDSIDKVIEFFNSPQLKKRNMSITICLETKEADWIRDELAETLEKADIIQKYV